MNKPIHIITSLAFVALFAACTQQVTNPRNVNEIPAITPDYTGVTIPATIAPLNFTMDEPFDYIHATITGAKEGEIAVSGKKHIQIPPKQWSKLLEKNTGDSLIITVALKHDGSWKQYVPFPVYVSPHPIDYGLVYRLIAPGYEVYSHIGIYQRQLSSFKQTALIENTLVPGSCVNCHSFKETMPGNMSLHIRGKHGGTLLQQGEDACMLNLKTDQTISAGVYPYWHPSGNYIAYSVNTTRQVFHSVADERIEVFDLESDVIVYDIVNNRVLTTPLLQTDNFENFPSFSPDGETLYFICAAKRDMPSEYKESRYNLCKIDFDATTGTFGNKIDTLVYAEAMGKSVSVPRPSYDGKYLMYTMADYGNFLIWHKEADLWLLDLESGETWPLTAANSPDADSYHSWSSNSRWFVFASRRDDGLYTRLYLSSIDDNGKATKAFLLPQKEPAVVDLSFYSYNVPEFVSGPVKMNIRDVEKKIVSEERRQAR